MGSSQIGCGCASLLPFRSALRNLFTRHGSCAPFVGLSGAWLCGDHTGAKRGRLICAWRCLTGCVAQLTKTDGEVLESDASLGPAGAHYYLKMQQGGRGTGLSKSRVQTWGLDSGVSLVFECTHPADWDQTSATIAPVQEQGGWRAKTREAAKAREEEDLRYMRERSIHAQLSPQDRQAVVASACGRLSEDAEERRQRRSAKAKAVAAEGRKKMVHRGKRLSGEAEAGLLSRLYTPPPPSGRRAKAEELERVRREVAELKRALRASSELRKSRERVAAQREAVAALEGRLQQAEAGS